METQRYSILVCDDEADIVSALCVYLRGEGYQVFGTHSAAQALQLLKQEDIHLLLMDIMMPEMDGISALVRLREESNVPVILLTAKSEDADKVLGLNLGADDYITKPFNPAELMARVRSQLRRYLLLGGGETRANLLRVGGVELDDAAKLVTVDGEAVNLTPKEYEILRCLMRRPGTVFSPGEIYRDVWGEPAPVGDGSLSVHIRHIREKIEANPAEPRYLKVVWGQGYKMEGGRP